MDDCWDMSGKFPPETRTSVRAKDRRRVKTATDWRFPPETEVVGREKDGRTEETEMSTMLPLKKWWTDSIRGR